MTDWLDPILVHAKRDKHRNLGIAYLRREDEDSWDALVIGADNQPLTFWSSPSESGLEKDAMTDRDGNVLNVVASTPPGVEARGLVGTPATATGSPVGTFTAIFEAEGYTMIRGTSKESKPPPPPPSQWNLASLLKDVAKHKGDEYVSATIEAADGGAIPVLLDWDGRPIMFWIDMPSEPSERKLVAAVATPSGIVAMAVDEMLRPEHSEEWMDQHLPADDGEPPKPD
jgi:hypothetical protein